MPAPTPHEIQLKIVAELPSSTSYDLAAKYGIDRSTVLDIARRHGVPIRPRGQPSLGVPTHYVLAERGWPFRPVAPKPLQWA